jgi:hypothetical protein
VAMQAYFSSFPAGVDIYTLRVTSQTSYLPEYITPTQKRYIYIYIYGYNFPWLGLINV